MRPGSVFDPVPQGRVVRHVVEHRIEMCPFVQILDAPVPQMGDQVLELLQKIVSSLVEPVQVLAVPKISFDRVPQRSEARSPQTAEQLVEVPTEPGYALAIIAVKTLGRRGARALYDQLVAPVPQGRQGGRGVLHDSRAGQGSPAAVVKQTVDIPVPQGRRGWGGGLQGLRPGQNSTADVEQIVDIPDSGSLQGFLPGQGSSSSSRLHDGTDDGIHGFFALFPGGKKVRRYSASRVRECPPVPAHPSWALIKWLRPGSLMRVGGRDW